VIHTSLRCFHDAFRGTRVAFRRLLRPFILKVLRRARCLSNTACHRRAASCSTVSFSFCRRSISRSCICLAEVRSFSCSMVVPFIEAPISLADLTTARDASTICNMLQAKLKAATPSMLVTFTKIMAISVCFSRWGKAMAFVVNAQR
jgi:hypothetical protein